MNNADRIVNMFMLGDYKDYHKNDRLRLTEYNYILKDNTPIGMFTEIYTIDNDEYFNYLLLTMQDFKSDKTWKKCKDDLVKAAMRQNIRIIFVPEIDMGFGLDKTINDYAKLKNPDECITELLSLAKYVKKPKYYSVSELMPNAFALIEPGYCEKDDTVLGYSFDQLNWEDELISGEKILTDYLKSIDIILEPCTFVMLQEPVKEELQDMISLGADRIYYGALNNDIYAHLPTYIQYTNDIYNGTIKSTLNLPIKYIHLSNKKVYKYYDKIRRKENDN